MAKEKHVNLSKPGDFVVGLQQVATRSKWRAGLPRGAKTTLPLLALLIMCSIAPMRQTARKKPLQHLRASDLRAAAQLATQATLGVSRIVEGVHQAVWRSLGAPAGPTPGQTRGLTGLIYQSVRTVTQWVGKGLDTALAKLQPLLAAVEDQAPDTPEREAVLAALNGVLGDRLAASHSPLATPMTLRYRDVALNWPTLAPIPAAGRKVLLLIHGLCMNDLQWRTQVRPPEQASPAGAGAESGAASEAWLLDHGTALAQTLGYSPIYLRYNTGLHTSQNGHELAAQLEQLLAHWPVAIQEITVLAHSMGGLVTRSALYYAQQSGLRWPRYLKNIIFLGTPQHGAPLERAGNWLDEILGSTPYSRPFAKLAQLRSAGITDLRYGHLLDADWQGHDRFRRQPDRREPVPLPEAVACYCVAATTAAKRSALSERLLGDGLVPLNSALGQHDDPQRRLAFAKDAQWIAYRTSHMALLSSPAVTQQLLLWLGKQAESAHDERARSPQR